MGKATKVLADRWGSSAEQLDVPLMTPECLRRDLIPTSLRINLIGFPSGFPLLTVLETLMGEPSPPTSVV